MIDKLQKLKKDLIYLIGYMGAGKSTIGKLLAEQLRWNFLDTDAIIENKQRCYIYEIFNKHGEEFFRKIESEILLEISKNKMAVIATGGGILIKEENQKVIKETGTSIWLKWKMENLIKNISGNKKIRPLYKDEEYFKILYQEREKLYHQADLIIECDNISSDEIIEEIVEFVELRVKN